MSLFLSIARVVTGTGTLSRKLGDVSLSDLGSLKVSSNTFLSPSTLPPLYPPQTRAREDGKSKGNSCRLHIHVYGPLLSFKMTGTNVNE